MSDIDPDHPGLDLVVGAQDNHIYAWHADGTPVAGYPLLLHDPKKVCAVDPVTNKMSYKAKSAADANDANPENGQDASIPIPPSNPGSKIVAGLSIGNADGHPGKEIAATVNEEYYETPNSSGIRDQIGQVLSQVVSSGNGRVYLLDRLGKNASGSPPAAPNGPCYPGSVQPTTFPGAQAALPGWPHKIASIDVGILPDVGEGPDGAATLGPVNGPGTLDVGVAMQAGPGYILKPDSTSQFGTGPDGKDITVANSPNEYKGTATDGPSFVAVGGGVFGRLLPNDNALGWAAPTGGLNRLLDIVEDEQQPAAQDEIGAWDAAVGSFFKGFPAEVNDLQFFASPAIADIDGDGVVEVLEGSAVSDLTATNTLDAPVSGWPKFTGGWMVATPGTGDFNGDGKLDVAAVTRDGWLFVWKTSGDACQTPEWPKYQHDLQNSGNYSSPVDKPASCSGPAPSPSPSPSVSPTSSPTSSPSASASPSATASASTSPSPTATPTTTPSTSPSATASSSPTPGPTPTPKPPRHHHRARRRLTIHFHRLGRHRGRFTGRVRSPRRACRKHVNVVLRGRSRHEHFSTLKSFSSKRSRYRVSAFVHKHHVYRTLVPRTRRCRRARSRDLFLERGRQASGLPGGVMAL
jgi:hypothetical protein